MNLSEKIYLFFGKQKLVSAIEKTIGFLEKSEDSVWSNLTVKETKDILKRELQKINNKQDFDKIELAVLFAPTSNIQEISMYNGWSKEYIEIAEIIDKFTNLDSV